MRRPAGLAETIRATLVMLAAGGLAATAGRAVAGDEATTASRVVVSLRVSGDLFAPAEADLEPVREPIALDARFDFVERPEAAAGPGGVARRYTTAAASIQVGEQEADQQPDKAADESAGEGPAAPPAPAGSWRLLAADAADVLVALRGTTAVPYLAAGFLSRDEAELLDTPFDPLLVDGLRPPAAVAAGDSWKVAGDLVAGLLAIDTVESGGLEATLEEVTDGQARLAVAGTVVGGVDGVPTRLEVRGTARIAATAATADGSWRLDDRVTRLEATISERREAGWVSPGLDVEATISLARLPLDEAPPAKLMATRKHAPRLGPAAGDRPAGAGRPGVVWHRHGGGRYAMVLDRRWRVVEDGPEGLVMRLVDRGALLAQSSVLPLPRAAADAPPGEDEVRDDVRRSLGDQFGTLVESEATTRDDGTRLVRVVADGAAAGRPFRWIHQVLTAPGGQRAAVTCMLEPALADRFAAADRELVAGMVVLPDPPDRSAAAGGTGPR
jgi:hypothetical protein